MAVAELGQKVSIGISNLFFDRQFVIESVNEKTRKALSHIGGLVRTIARRSIRKRKKESEPGQPPSSHSGLLRGTGSGPGIYYAFDPVHTSVVIGPTPLNQISYVFVGGGEGRKFIRGAIPSILEKGGMVGIREVKNPITGLWERTPWGKKTKERLIPVWKATPKEKAASKGVKTIVKGKHAINFYRVPVEAIESRIRYATIQPRPYMVPAMMKTKDRYASAWSYSGGARVTE